MPRNRAEPVSDVRNSVLTFADGDPSLLGLARVSTRDQDPNRQIDALAAAGCGTVRVEHGVSGIAASRPALDDLLDHARRGDVVVVTELSRLGRSMARTVALIAELADRGIGVRSLTQGIDTASSGAVSSRRRLHRPRTDRARRARRAHAGRLGGRPAPRSAHRQACGPEPRPTGTRRASCRSGRAADRGRRAARRRLAGDGVPGAGGSPTNAPTWAWYGWRCRRQHHHPLLATDEALRHLLARVVRRRGRWAVICAGDGSGRFGQVAALGHGRLGVELSDHYVEAVWPVSLMPTGGRLDCARLRGSGRRRAPFVFPGRSQLRAGEAERLIAEYLLGHCLPDGYNTKPVRTR